MKRLHVELGADSIETESNIVSGANGDVQVNIGGELRSLRVLRGGSDPLVLLDRRVLALRTLLRSSRERLVFFRGRWQQAVVGPPGAPTALRGSARDATLTSPMPGRIVAISVRAGDRVEPGQLLLVIEAMKMQNELHADAARTVDSVLVNAGDTVERGAALLKFEA
jgi:biotin carboxyl carrier protein